MALFMIERNFAASLNASAEDLRAVVDINTVVGVKWLYSFLSADKRKTYCLYEAESGEAIREAARRAGLTSLVLMLTLVGPRLAAQNADLQQRVADLKESTAKNKEEFET